MPVSVAQPDRRWERDAIKLSNKSTGEVIILLRQEKAIITAPTLLNMLIFFNTWNMRIENHTHVWYSLKNILPFQPHLLNNHAKIQA